MGLAGFLFVSGRRSDKSLLTRNVNLNFAGALVLLRAVSIVQRRGKGNRLRGLLRSTVLDSPVLSLLVLT